jgi:CelD/BcsL family acetyltransferase involved in cellulose biosynthesis
MSTIPISESRQPVGGQPPDATDHASPLPDRCEIVRDFARLEALAPEWSRLWEADPLGEVFQSFAWNRAWWRACGASVELCTPVVFAGREVIGILPLIRRNGRLEFLGSPHADYGDVICAEESTGQVLAWSLRELQKLGDWREGFLDGLPEESRIVRHFAELPADVRGDLQLIASERCYTIQLGEHPAEMLDGLARKQHLRRRQNKLEKAGKVVFRHIENVPEALQHLEMFFVCQRRRRALHGKSSAAESEDFRQLLRNLVQDFDLKNDLHFGVLELDAKPIAWHLSFEAHDKLVFYQQTFAVDAWDFAPGEALLRYLLLFAKGRVTREFDFTRGDEPFKARFGNHERVVYQLWMQPRGLGGKVSGARRKLAGSMQGAITRLRSAAKQDKGIFERWRAARAWWTEHAQPRAGDSQTTRASFAGTIWKNETLLVLAAGQAPMTPSKAPNVVLTLAGLGDLVDFAQENPQVIRPTRVLDLRERFRNGDRAFLYQREGRSVSIAWVSERPLQELLQLPGDAAELERAMILYELWESRSSTRADTAAVLASLRSQAELLQLPLWIVCDEKSEMLGEAERVGFQRRYKVHRRKRFGKIVHIATAKTD